MFRDGLGIPRDVGKAKALFLAASQKDLADAHVNLGKLHFGKAGSPLILLRRLLLTQ